MRPLRVLALVALAAALGVACMSAHADVYEYDVTISVPDGSAAWSASSEAGSYTSAWSATWHDVNVFTTPFQQMARVEPASFSRKLSPPPNATPTSGGVTGSWHGTSGSNWSCSMPAGLDFPAFGPLEVVLSGGGLDPGVASQSTSYAQTGKIGLSTTYEGVTSVVHGACTGIDADPYEVISPHVWVGLDTCFADATRRGDTLSFPVDELGQPQISFQVKAAVGPGSEGLVCYDRAYGDSWHVTGTYNVTMTRVDGPVPSYGGNLGVSRGVLDELSFFEAKRNDALELDLLKIESILRRDAQRHPGARARKDRKTL